MGRKKKNGIKALSKLATDMLIQNRTIEKWIQATPDYCHFSNLSYIVDATYLYTYGGSNAILLVLLISFVSIIYTSLN